MADEIADPLSLDALEERIDRWLRNGGRMFGKQIDAWTWLASMSARRAVWS